MDLSFNARVEGRYTVIEAVGEIDVYTAPALREQVVNLVDSGVHHLILDLEGVEFFDSTGLGVLVGARKRLLAHNGSFSLVCTRENVLKIFRITSLDTVFALHVGVAEAAAAIDALV